MTSSAVSVLKSKRRFRPYAFGSCGRLLRAVRPLAASAPLATFETLKVCAGSSASSPRSASRFGKGVSTSFSKASQVQGSLSVSSGHGRASSGFALAQGSLPLKQFVASSRSHARKGSKGPASTRCCAARAGEVRLLACDSTQRKMQGLAGRAICVRPNPSIERTLSGLRPPSASHVKR